MRCSLTIEQKKNTAKNVSLLRFKISQLNLKTDPENCNGERGATNQIYTFVKSSLF